MPPVAYPDLAWSGRPSRLRHALRVVAIAGSIGALGGAAGVLAAMGLPGGSVRPKSTAAVIRPAPAAPRATMTAQSPPATNKSALPPQPSQSAQSQHPQSSHLSVALQQQPPALPQTSAARPASSFDQAPPAAPSHSALAASPPPGEPQHAAPKHALQEAEHGAMTAAQADQASRAAQDQHVASKTLYDRAEPAASNEGSSNPSISSPSVASRKRTIKRTRRPAVADVPGQYGPEQRAQYGSDVPPPPMQIVPGRGYRTWRADDGDAGDYRYSRSGSYYGRDAWRDRRRDDDYDRDSGPSNPIAGFFGFLSGQD
jgi:hypothetical protein